MTNKPNSKRRFVGIDPSLTNTGIVILKPDGSVQHYHNVKTKAHGKSRQAFFERLTRIGEGVRWILNEYLFQGSALADNTAVVYAPIYVHGATAGNFSIPTVNGMAWMALRGLMEGVYWDDDQKVRSQLRLLGYKHITAGLKGGKLTKAVKNYWPDCPNEHCACAWMAAEYARRMDF